MSFWRSLVFHILFLLIFILVLAGQILERMEIEYWVKPLVMPVLAFIFLLSRKKKAGIIPVLLAFFFSWWGDNLLMFSGRGDIWFFSGVGSFFLAQCVYIFVFARRKSAYGGMGLVQRKPWWLIPFVLYLAAMLYVLHPGMEGMLRIIIPVYALSLLAMSALALNRRYRVNLSSFRLVFAGSVFFVLSDSMIAVNRFYSEIHRAGFWIMLTYMIAQFLIMRGLALEE